MANVSTVDSTLQGALTGICHCLDFITSVFLCRLYHSYRPTPCVPTALSPFWCD